MINNLSSPAQAFCRSGRDNKRNKTDCLSGRRSGCLSDEGIIFSRQNVVQPPGVHD